MSMKQEARTVATIQNHALDDIRVRRSTYKGGEFVDLRQFIEPNDGTERIPTRKGITVRINLLPELLEALHQVETEAREAGHLE